MRSLLLSALLVACALVCVSAGGAQDADDVALMELGIDLAHSVTPSPTYTSIKPINHEDVLQAKFPMLHEMKGLEAKDWSDIQSLLFREPPSAVESSVDMKLDELEAKFDKLDTKPIPSSVAPAGSTLLPSLKKENLGLRATLPAHLPKKSLLQVGASKGEVAQAKKAQASKKALMAGKKAPAAAAAPKPVAAKAAANKAVVSVAKAAVAKAATKPAAAAAAKPLTPDEAKAAEAAAKKSTDGITATISTVRLIEKRMKGLATLVQRLKSQIGLKTEETATSASRLTSALGKHRKEKKELAARMAARKTRFAQVDMEAGAASDAFVESQTESESDAHTETAAEAESELAADAEAVDQILESLM